MVENKEIAVQTLISSIELFLQNNIALLSEITQYQKKVGSILYTAVITRPDIAFAVSRLVQFLTNPSPIYQAATDRVLLYLQNT